MLYSQYLRIETIAGGVGATTRQFIRACHTRLGKRGKSRELRDTRHKWIRDGIAEREYARELYRDIIRANL